jgi:aryl-alcohol dehydrogenase-like predicted oxidoreductase
MRPAREIGMFTPLRLLYNFAGIFILKGGDGMQHRKLGNGELVVSALGLGCMSMSGVYGRVEEADCIAVIHRALDLGINFLDTADMYGWGHNEGLVGRALRGRREGVILASKFGQVQSPDGKGNLVDGSPRYVARACDASLNRLGVEVIDLYYQHRVDPQVPIEETVGAMSRLIEQGKVRFLGLSEAAPATIRRAHAIHNITALQSEYSLLYRNPAEEVLPCCRELKISYIAYSPLGRGLLGAGIRGAGDLTAEDRRLQHPRFQGENLDLNIKAVSRVEEIAREKGITSAQLALAWLIAQGEDIVPIPGTKRISSLEENIGALSVTLSRADLEAINETMPVGVASGLRWSEAQMKTVNI